MYQNLGHNMMGVDLLPAAPSAITDNRQHSTYEFLVDAMTFGVSPPVRPDYIEEAQANRDIA